LREQQVLTTVPANETPWTDAAGKVWSKFNSELEAVNNRLSKDREADPKSPPSRHLVERRIRLEQQLRMTEQLAAIFSEDRI
jgi:hypothetical protein